MRSDLLCSLWNGNYSSNLHPLEVVGRGSETQLQVGKNLLQIRINTRV